MYKYNYAYNINYSNSFPGIDHKPHNIVAFGNPEVCVVQSASESGFYPIHDKVSYVAPCNVR